MLPLQYHPEVMHSEGGNETIRHFLLEVRGGHGQARRQSPRQVSLHTK